MDRDSRPADSLSAWQSDCRGGRMAATNREAVSLCQDCHQLSAAVTSCQQLSAAVSSCPAAARRRHDRRKVRGIWASFHEMMLSVWSRGNVALTDGLKVENSLRWLYIYRCPLFCRVSAVDMSVRIVCRLGYTAAAAAAAAAAESAL